MTRRPSLTPYSDAIQRSITASFASLAAPYGGLESGRCCCCGIPLYDTHHVNNLPEPAPPASNQRPFTFTYMPNFGYHDVGTHGLCERCNVGYQDGSHTFDPGNAPCGYVSHQGHPAHRTVWASH
jgi:hypothetical protein